VLLLEEEPMTEKTKSKTNPNRDHPGGQTTTLFGKCDSRQFEFFATYRYGLLDLFFLEIETVDSVDGIDDVIQVIIRENAATKLLNSKRLRRRTWRRTRREKEKFSEQRHETILPQEL
jgi:hypothetical protein